MDAGEALALLVELTEALDAAGVELHALAEMEDVPLPDELLKQLEERDAMRATLGRLIDESANPRRMRTRGQDIYREEIARAHRSDDAPPMPVNADVLRQLEAMSEALRRRALTDTDLADALDGALLRSTLGD